MVAWDLDKLVALSLEEKQRRAIRRHPVTGLPMTHGEWCSYCLRITRRRKWEERNARKGWWRQADPPNRMRDKIILAIQPGEVVTRWDLKRRGLTHTELTYPMNQLVKMGYLAAFDNADFVHRCTASGPQACPNVYVLTDTGQALRADLLELIDMLG